MAEDTLEPAWDDQTDTFITNIDKTISKDYGISLRDLLMDPDRFAETKDVLATVDKIRGAIEDYFNSMRDAMADAKATFTKALEDADAQTNKMDAAISTKTSFARVPYIKANDIDYNVSAQEEITIDAYNNAADALVTKFVNISNYVGDISSVYGKYTIGSWIFSGQKAYVVSVYLPDSPMVEIDRLNEQIDGLLEAAYQQLKLNIGA